MKAFISHSSKDASLARRLKKRLTRSAFEVFWAEDDVAPGDNLAMKLGQALEAADWVVVLLTPGAGKSANLRAEVEYAIGTPRLKDRLIPVFVGKAALADTDIPWILRRLPHITTTAETDFEEVLERLAEPAH